MIQALKRWRVDDGKRVLASTRSNGRRSSAVAATINGCFVVDDRRVISGIVHVLKGAAAEGPGRPMDFDNGLQSFQPMSDVGFGSDCFEAVVRSDASDTQMIDVRQPRPSLGGRRKRGALAQAIGRSRGRRTTKIHAVVDWLGRLIAFEITRANSAMSG